MSDSNRPSRAGRVVRAGLLSFIPGYPIYRALQSLKQTVRTGAQTLSDRTEDLAAQRRDSRVATYSEAMAKRTEDSMPLEAIERLCARHKQFFMTMTCVSIAFVLGSLFGENYFGALIGFLFSMLCVMFALKYEHRLWQMETGRAAPDEPLGSFRQFFSTPGAIRRVLDLHL
ncbi:hypothetical protein [Burkholderia ubonensis]|uniref:Uncharacterized protein n=1 Tax=Burkholderia ubonensis subsp. mesacidophila TaxID=265293 RepID=A0A2A4FBM3_9BURK|nr:hypothetical protein [Burkholderia ubonensis]PCE30082.1 hypothetical protein BZL54_23235 [Burkholderia ubonensis subsp. mesacidophila]